MILGTGLGQSGSRNGANHRIFHDLLVVLFICRERAWIKYWVFFQTVKIQFYFIFLKNKILRGKKKQIPTIKKKSQLHTWWVKTITLKEGSRHAKRMPINMTLKEGKLTWTEVNVDGNSIWVTKWSVKETLFKAYSSEVDVFPRTSHHASSFSCKNKNKLSLFTN